jgi:hypothetical protein
MAIPIRSADDGATDEQSVRPEIGSNTYFRRWLSWRSRRIVGIDIGRWFRHGAREGCQVV